MAKWYYADGSEKKGPLSEEEFDRLISAGTILPDTLVWRKGMSGWQTLGEVHGEKTVIVAHGETVSTQAASVESRPRQEVTAEPASSQALRSPGLAYAGAGKRFMAKVIDLIFMFVMATLVDGLSRRLFPVAQAGGGSIDKVYIVTMLIDMLLGMIYMTWFIGKFGATPGKMVLSLKVVTVSGGKVGYGQAFGRYWAESVVIWLTLMLGYLPILFDSQKRGLHDRICNTRVVKI